MTRQARSKQHTEPKCVPRRNKKPTNHSPATTTPTTPKEMTTRDEHPSCGTRTKRNMDTFSCPEGCVLMIRENVLFANGAACYRVVGKEVDPVLPEGNMYLRVVDFKAPVSLKKGYLTLEEYENNTKTITNTNRAFRKGDTVSIIYSSVYEKYLAGRPSSNPRYALQVPSTNDQMMDCYSYYPNDTELQQGQRQEMTPTEMMETGTEVSQEAESHSHQHQQTMYGVDPFGEEELIEEECGGLLENRWEEDEEDEVGMVFDNLLDDYDDANNKGVDYDNNDDIDKIPNEKESNEDEIEEKKCSTKRRTTRGREDKDLSNVWIVVEKKDTGKVELWQRNVELIGSILKDGTESLMPVKVLAVGYSFMRAQTYRKKSEVRRKCYQISFMPKVTLWVDEELFISEKEATQEAPSQPPSSEGIHDFFHDDLYTYELGDLDMPSYAEQETMDSSPFSQQESPEQCLFQSPPLQSFSVPQQCQTQVSLTPAHPPPPLEPRKEEKRKQRTVKDNENTESKANKNTRKDTKKDKKTNENSNIFDRNEEYCGGNGFYYDWVI